MIHLSRAIEENALKTCTDIIHNCVVVGHQKVCPILVVEPEPAVDVSTPVAVLQAKTTIIERTAAFNERLFAHEQITATDCILFVPTGSLPRTTVSRLCGMHQKAWSLIIRIRRREMSGT